MSKEDEASETLRELIECYTGDNRWAKDEGLQAVEVLTGIVRELKARVKELEQKVEELTWKMHRNQCWLPRLYGNPHMASNLKDDACRSCKSYYERMYKNNV